MRLPVCPNVSTKEGTSNKNARLTNCLKETSKRGDRAVIRPGLVLTDTFTGVGSGLIPFDGRLLVVYGNTVTDGDLWPWPLDSNPWDAGTTYGAGQSTWYYGNLWFSLGSGNIGNTPGAGSAYWATSYELGYDSGGTYNFNEQAVVDGVTYYSSTNGNTGHTPGATAHGRPQGWWSTTPHTVGQLWKFNPGGSTAYPTLWAANAAYCAGFGKTDVTTAAQGALGSCSVGGLTDPADCGCGYYWNTLFGGYWDGNYGYINSGVDP